MGARIVRGDVRQPDSLPAALDGADVVYHLAGRTRGFSYNHFSAVNADGCRNMAAACALQSRPPVLVVVSSLAAAGPSRPGVPHTEADVDSPVSHYGRTKLAGEWAVTEFAGDVPISIVRPPIVFGPGGRDTLEIFRPIWRTGLHLVPGHRELALSLIYVADLVHALQLVAERGERITQNGQLPAAGQETGQQRGVGQSGKNWLAQSGPGTLNAPRPGLYYASNPEPTTYAEIGRLAGAAMNRRVRVLRVRRGGVYLGAVWGEIMGRILRRPAIMNLDRAREATAGAWVCSPKKIQCQLGFMPAAPLEDCFQETADWVTSELMK
jgi:nucleoside-diphosphate-sugar epimerase